MEAHAWAFLKEKLLVGKMITSPNDLPVKRSAFGGCFSLNRRVSLYASVHNVLLAWKEFVEYGKDATKNSGGTQGILHSYAK